MEGYTIRFWFGPLMAHPINYLNFAPLLTRGGRTVTGWMMTGRTLIDFDEGLFVVPHNE
jgi:hypothetical protein